jgi:2-hydroxy-3-keto-5-methylthiopentenyl-1-phosphate phosphatase
MSVRIFCDFDGTMTVTDNILMIMEHYNPPNWRSIVEDMMRGTRSIRDGVGSLFSLIPSALREDIVRTVMDKATLRPGVLGLLIHAHACGVPFYVVSGGIDFFIRPILAHIPPSYFAGVYCNSASFDPPTITITWPHPCGDACTDDCGMCKTTVMRHVPFAHTTIVIGDSITDYNAAKQADIVFARAHLYRHCLAHGVPCIAYETFYDIMDTLVHDARTREAFTLHRLGGRS